MKNRLRKLVPESFLQWYRNRKKNQVKKSLEKQRSSGNVVTKNKLIEQLKTIGIKQGDTLMVHSAMSKIGYLENGPETFINALLEVVGTSGNLLMPSSPVDKLQLDYIREAKVFDVLNTPSKMGAISEYFRNMAGVKRSTHPTEPVCAYGPKADFFTKDHFGQITPYGKNSPWHRLMQDNGKILYVGVTLINAGTNLHVLEDLTKFKYPVYFKDIFEIEVVNHIGFKQKVKTKVHNPAFSIKRKCDELIPRFKKDNVLQDVNIGNAQCLLLDSKGMLNSMLRGYEEKEITMYTPNGEKIDGYE